MAETIDADSASWDDIKATSILTGLLAVVLTAVFEIARRNPAVSAVFDRRRGRYAHRTPPPLLRNTILEWLFLSNSDGYKKYAVLSHMRDVITERWRQKKKLKRLKEKFSKNDSWNEDQFNTENNDSGSYSDEQDRTRSNANAETTSTNNNSQYQIRQRAAKLTHYLTPDAVEFNGRRLPAEIAEYAMAGDLTMEQLDDYEQRLLYEEEKEEVKFKLLRDDFSTKAGGCRGSKRRDVADQQDGISIPSGKKNLILPPRESRLRFFGFQQGKVNAGNNTRNNIYATTPSTPNSQETFRNMWEKGKSKIFSTMNISEQVSSPASPQQSLIQNQDVRVNHHVNRHLKSTSVSDIRPLTSSDRETLRCIGLDYFVMIRFLRFCFTITFYPFLISCITLIPTYYTNIYDVNDTNENLVINEHTHRYFRFTVNRLEQSSDKLWVTCSFAFFFYCFVLRRLWIEWETFIVLRFEFLANGDADYEEALAAASRPNDFKKRRRTIPKKDDVRLHLEQFRNSCIVEYIPESHQRDQELFQFYDAVFPGQVKRAEIMINPPKLNDLIARRQATIELYEQFYAKHNHAKQKYSQKMMYLEQKKRTVFDRCYTCSTPQKPIDPTMSPSLDSASLLRKCCCCYALRCGENKVKALPYLSSEIKRLNREVENEYQVMLDEKRCVEDRAAPLYGGILDARVAAATTFLTGVGGELTGSTGFVEFTTLTAKQSALQCNLTGTNRYMVTTSAPDPRDVIWENVTVEHKTISIKKVQFDGLLFTGTLFWSVAVSAVISMSDINLISKYLPARLVPLIEGYIPVVLLELLMKVITVIFEFIARRFIRFKTNSEVDGFVFKWHLAYRVANLVIIIADMLKTFDILKTNPQAAMDSLVTGIAVSSQFFLNNMIVATGTELLLELAQIPKMLYHFMLHKYITVEATSKRVLDQLKVPKSLEWGETIPPFIFGLLIAMVYSTLVPIVTGVCALYFYLATKVYTHQSLFVYAQLYEGGGVIMYQLNRSIFVIIYISIIIFSFLFSLKKDRIAGLAFGIIMTIITVLVDIKITKDFVKPSITLALTNARIIDAENTRCQELSRKYQEYKAAKREKKKEEVKDTLAKSTATSNVKFKHGIDENLNFHGESEGGGNSYIPSSLRVAPKYKNNSSALSSSSSGQMQFGSLKRRVASQVSDDSGGKASLLSSDSNKSSADTFNNDEDFYLYRQPQLNKALWETTPRPYWY